MPLASSLSASATRATATTLFAALAVAAPTVAAQPGGEGGMAGQWMSPPTAQPAASETVAVSAGASLDPANPAMTPVGLWRTIDDQTGQARSLVRIEDRGQTLVGEVVEILDPARRDVLCSLCPGDRKDRPVLGLQIIRDLKRFDDRWADGRILNPEDGNIYHLRATPRDGGRKLEMHGYLSLPFLGRTQTWIRESEP